MHVQKGTFRKFEKTKCVSLHHQRFIQSDDKDIEVLKAYLIEAKYVQDGTYGLNLIHWKFQNHQYPYTSQKFIL